MQKMFRTGHALIAASLAIWSVAKRGNNATVALQHGLFSVTLHCNIKCQSNKSACCRIAVEQEVSKVS